VAVAAYATVSATCKHPTDTGRVIIAIPATDFLYELPDGNTIIDAQAALVPWLFNNTAIVMKSLSNMITRVNIPQSGRYYLFVRSIGREGSTFRVAVDDKETERAS